MDMTMDYYVMDDIYDDMSQGLESYDDYYYDDYAPAYESEYREYQDTRRNFGGRIIGLIRSIFARIIATIVKLINYIGNFFKNIKDGMSAVRAANATSDLKAELDRIVSIASNQAVNIVHEIKGYGIAGAKLGEKIVKRHTKNAAKDADKQKTIDSIAPKINEYASKTDGAIGRYDKLETYIRNAAATAAKKTGATSDRDAIKEVSDKVKKRCEKDIKSYLEDAKAKYEKLQADLTGDNAYDVEGAKALGELNTKVCNGLRRLVSINGTATSGGGSAATSNNGGSVAKSVASDNPDVASPPRAQQSMTSASAELSKEDEEYGVRKGDGLHFDKRTIKPGDPRFGRKVVTSVSAKVYQPYLGMTMTEMVKYGKAHNLDHRFIKELIDKNKVTLESVNKAAVDYAASFYPGIAIEAAFVDMRLNGYFDNVFDGIIYA